VADITVRYPATAYCQSAMSSYETLTILVTVGAAVVGLVDYLRSGGPLAQLAHREGRLWFDHADERPLEERPSEDEPDAPIPRRPLRGRIDLD
jgi:hypothetical protein